MVTIEEIDQREKELTLAETQANSILRKPIPQRRFGSRVTRKDQLEIQDLKNKAKENLIQISSQRRQLIDVRQQVLDQMASDKAQGKLETRRKHIQRILGREAGIRADKESLALKQTGITRTELQKSDLNKLPESKLIILENAGLIKREGVSTSGTVTSRTSAATGQDMKQEAIKELETPHKILNPKSFPSILERTFVEGVNKIGSVIKKPKQTSKNLPEIKVEGTYTPLPPPYTPIEPAYGFTSIEQGEVLVTPSGKIVGSAFLPNKIQGVKDTSKGQVQSKATLGIDIPFFYFNKKKTETTTNDNGYPSLKNVYGFVKKEVGVNEVRSYPETFKAIIKDITTNYPKVETTYNKVKSKTNQNSKLTSPVELTIREIFDNQLVKNGDVQRFLEKNKILPSKEFLSSEKGKEFQENVDFLLLGAGATPKGIGSQQFKVVQPLRERNEAFGLQFEKIDEFNGKQMPSADITIFTEKTPPRITYTTSLNDLALRKDLKDFGYLKPVITKTKTPFKAFSEEPYYAFETKTGKTGKLSLVSGETKEINVFNYKDLPTNQKDLIQSLVEYKTGSPINPSNNKQITKLFNKNNQRYISDIDVEKQIIIRKPRPQIVNEQIVNKKFDIVPLGKRTTRFQAITEVSPINEEEFFTFTGKQRTFKENEFFEYRQEKIIFREDTFPFMKGKKRESLNVFIETQKEPNIISTKNNVNVIPPANIEKTPFSKTFQEQVKKQIQEQTRFLKVPPPKTPKAITKTFIVSTPTNLPKNTFVSQFAGTGLYERTSEGGQLPSVRERVYVSNKDIQDSLSVTRTTTLVGQDTFNKEIQREISKNITKLSPKEITKEIQKNVPKLEQKPQLKQVPKLTTKEVPKLRIPPFETITPRTRLSTSKVFFKFSKKPSPNSGRGSSLGFRSYVIKAGKRVYLRSILPKGLALRKGESAALTSLRATFGVEPTKFKVKQKDIFFKPRNDLFRSYRIKQGKRVPLKDTYIQRLTKRLSFRPEIVEIQTARRRSR